MSSDLPPPLNAVALPVMRAGLLAGTPLALRAEAVSLHYGERQILHALNLAVPARRVTALVGPSGCGKSTFLRCCNRLNDEIEDCRVSGSIRLGDDDIRSDALPVPELRRRVGMVFQTPNPFPLTVYDNVAYGLRLAGLRRRRELDEQIEAVLRQVGLWDEVAMRLHADALTLSSGQQQRLVIARALAVQPEILLLDEPAAMLDPISTLRFEELVHQLAQRYTVLLVTHNMQQAARVADYTAFMYQGRVLEFGDTDSLFTNPQRRETEDYITGKFR